MSPPPGFPRHADPPTQQIPYSMGLLGVDGTTQHVIAEYRDFGNANSLKAFLGKVFDFAQARGLSGNRTWVKNADDLWEAPPPPPGAAVPALGAATAYKVLT
jgi:hypothetical protein